jgi:AcrR family transcriptional regulator
LVADPEDLIRSAERLFAQHGISGVSLREISRASGYRNVAAIQYHFGDRDGLVQAIAAKHAPAVEIRRNALIDEYVTDDIHDVRKLAAALVRPLAAELSNDDGGPEFLRVLAEAIGRPRPMVDLSITPSMVRWRDVLEPMLDPDAVRLHRRFAAFRLTAEELGRRAMQADRRRERLFISDLIDLVCGLLTAPVSEETRRSMSSHDAPA